MKKELIIKDKYSQENISAVQLLATQEIGAIIQHAVKGFEIYKKWSAGNRAAVIKKLEILLSERKEEFAQLIMREAGKPISYARIEVERCLMTLQIACSETLRFTGETVPLDFASGEGKTAFTKRFPVGVVSCFTPFNFPLNLALHKIAPALAVGCSVIVKPSPHAPLTTLLFASLIKQTELPDGVFNVVLCDNQDAEILVRDERIKMFSFTGSEKVGWHLKNLTGKKKVTLELGGNAGVIIDDSADLVNAAIAIARGAYIYYGQICISTQRIYVLESKYVEFLNFLLIEISKIKSGNPADPDVMVGPMIDKVNLHRIDEWIKNAIVNGATVLTGGRILDDIHNIFEPTLLTDTKPTMNIVCEEVFGPVAIIEKIKTMEDGIEKVNDSKFGLQAGVFTNNLSNMKLVFDTTEVGAVIINNIPGFRVDNMPYGGVKNSGFGREGIKYAMEEMSEPRLIVF